ncbi:SRPBCC domain-containing protein [uncultured Mucilaginibacter sp.]|uniref:SRPBCC domain-containing protein n=1 Tax=uncultured Mucilaginibacter sp. TaxID=797541 RepID=UPI00261BDE6F|nr:SRPBCC domain-containing protein [uncultured Mucilaginibacter sp.]
MNEPKIVKSEIVIDTTPAKVWDALVNPAKTQIYMFGCETVSDWKIGSDLLWRGEYEGQEMVFVKGKILEMEPGNLLKYTVIDPFASYPDIPENYLNVTYQLTEEGGKTKLTVTQDGFETAAEGEKRYQDTYNNGQGWNPILVQIKEVAESN